MLLPSPNIIGWVTRAPNDVKALYRTISYILLTQVTSLQLQMVLWMPTKSIHLC